MTEEVGLAVKLKEAMASKATWTTAQVNKFPDGSFALICSGGEKDSEGKTTPRSLRKLPYKDAQGNIDAPHTRNALARLNQVECGGKVISQELQDKIRARLQKALATTKKSMLMAEKAISYDREVRGVCQAFEQHFKNSYMAAEVLDEFVVANSYEDPYDTYYQVKYTKGENGQYEFAPQDQWIRGRYQFVAD